FRTDRGGDRQGGGRARDLPVAAPRVPQRARRHRLWCARRSRWFEAALYVAQGYAEKGVAPLALQFGWRYALFGLGGHAMSTGIFGAFLGIALRTHRRWVPIPAPIAGLILSIVAHMLNNPPPLLASLATCSSAEPPASPHATELSAR